MADPRTALIVRVIPTSVEQNWTDRRMLMQWAWGSELGGPVNGTSVSGGTAALQSFVTGALSIATSNNAQGVILWDPEGNQSGGSGLNVFTFVGDPRLLSSLNPTVDSVIDTYVGQVHSAGLKFGCTIRGQQANLGARTNDTYPDDTTAINDMIAKTQYAITRWGATLFYVDSNDRNKPYIIQALFNTFPNCLFIPEHTYDDPGGINTTLEAPFLPCSAPLTYAGDEATSINTFSVGTGFAAMYLDSNTSAGTITADQANIVTALQRGSILGPVAGWYNSPQMGTVPAIKSAAGYP